MPDREQALPRHEPLAAKQPDKLAESREIWEAMEREPGFADRLSKAVKDSDAGLATPYRPRRRG